MNGLGLSFFLCNKSEGKEAPVVVVGVGGMWVEILCGLIIYRLVKCFLYTNDDLLDLNTSDSSALFSVADRYPNLFPFYYQISSFHFIPFHSLNSKRCFNIEQSQSVSVVLQSGEAFWRKALYGSQDS